MYLERPYFKTIKKRIVEKRNLIQVITGPRQVGKTTMIRQLVKSDIMPSMYVTADAAPAAGSIWLSGIWNEARLKLLNEPSNEFLLIIDEIQKVDNWSETVKKEWDTDTFNEVPLKVIILGSSRLLIQQGLTESLAGRFEVTYVPHWSFSEMQTAFDIGVDKYIWFGGYPGSTSLMKDEDRWRNYVVNAIVETAISKDILMLTRIEKPALLKRLFEIGCYFSSQIVSLTKIQGELQEKGNITTLSLYLSLLQDAGLLCGLSKYTNDAMFIKRGSKPKFQVFNNALMSSITDNTFKGVKSDPALWGRHVESAVGTHLLNSSIIQGFQLHYWNENSREVDFVIEKNGVVVGIEVKSGKSSYNEGMALFAKKYQPKSMFIVGTDGIPIEEFLSMDVLSLFDV
ncbi:MAG: AAA family ATPase [Bacteroidales bacterium]|jgi:predicted AAA+ superfamily ATPase|nr:AAA family ATPase [Bacteroidales bacterium]